MEPLPPDQLPATPEARATYIKQAQQAGNFGALTALFMAELMAQPAFPEAMAPYFEGGHALFARQYALQKAVAYIQGPRELARTDERLLAYRHAAAEHLWEIQQKKLFDLQCRWRAEQLPLPIRHTHEFEPWGEYIDHCPWLPPLTAAEVQLYAAYLRSGSYERVQIPVWQAYDRFRAAPDDYRHQPLPAWYAFHNAHTDAGALLYLPDIRGDKEAYYIGLTEADKAAKLAAKAAAGDDSASRPWPPLVFKDAAAAEPFFAQFEPAADLPRLLRWHRAASANEAHKWGPLQDAIFWLETALEAFPDPWPIGANADWRVALAEAGTRFWAHQLAEVIEEVWQEQEQNRTLGLPVTPPARAAKRRPFEEIDWQEETSYHPKFILHGRGLAGEPRDFDF